MFDQQTFRLRRSVLLQGAFFAIVLLGIMAIYASLFFLDNPQKDGFKDARSAALMGAMGLLVFGFMLLLSLYMVLAYYVERFTLQGSTVFVRSVFQNRQFDRAEIQSVKWKVFPNGGAIRFRVFGCTTRLDLHGFGRDDRLGIIRIVRNLVPAEKQEGWDTFCHRIALPLRDGKSATERVDDSSPAILISRKRYDRLACFLFPASIVVAVLFWWRLALPQFFVLPPLVIAFWLLLRFNVPKQGQATAKLTSVPAGRAQLAGWSTMVLAQLLFLAMALAGFGKNVTCTVVAVFVIVGMIPFFVWQIKADREKKVAEQKGAQTADAEWQRGEAALSS